MKKIQNGNTATINYTGKLEDGSIFDSSLNEGREPLVANVGKGELIKGFENALLDMSEGEKKTIEIPCEEAYGEVNDQLITEVSKSQVPEGVEVGHMLQGMGPMGPVNVKVVGISDETVTVDANHPLAGKKLIFDLEVVSIS